MKLNETLSFHNGFINEWNMKSKWIIKWIKWIHHESLMKNHYHFINDYIISESVMRCHYNFIISVLNQYSFIVISLYLFIIISLCVVIVFSLSIHCLFSMYSNEFIVISLLFHCHIIVFSLLFHYRFILCSVCIHCYFIVISLLFHCHFIVISLCPILAWLAGHSSFKPTDRDQAASGDCVVNSVCVCMIRYFWRFSNLISKPPWFTCIVYAIYIHVNPCG